MRRTVRRFLRRRESGFTMIELIIVLAILFIASVMLLPRLFWFVDRAKLRSAAVATKTMVQTARLASLRGGGEGRVVFDYPKRLIYAFVDGNANGLWDTSSERLIGQYSLSDASSKATVRFMRDTDAGPDTAGAVDMFDDAPTCGGNACVVFNSSGASPQAGSIFFTDGYWNFIEVRISLVGKVDVFKLNRASGQYVPERLRAEAGGRAASWTWYEERDNRVPL